MNHPIRIATRRSALALVQAGMIADALRAAGADVELVEVTTFGDRSAASLESLGGVGVFVAAVRDAVLAGRADLAVHSMKDLPTVPAEGLRVAAVPPRADARDALISRSGSDLAGLPRGASVGTGSPRRRAQVLRMRSDLDVVGLRGNVDTRIARALNGDLDAVILAKAGLDRLGRGDVITEALRIADFPPAPAQGALAVESTADLADSDPELADLLARLHDADTAAAVTAERSALAMLEAGCSAPVGAIGAVDGGVLTLTIAVYPRAGGEPVTASVSGAPGEALALGSTAATQVLHAGADQLLREVVR